MRIQLLSDLHLEFERDESGSSFMMWLDPSNVDVLVLAGDICSQRQLHDVLADFCRLYPHVVYVVGNHEFYGSTRDIVYQKLGRVAAKLPNLHWLDCSSVEIEGVRFLGAPMWFRCHPTNFVWEGMMNDFNVILDDFRAWVYRDNQHALEFFDREMREGDIVVTHHLPTFQSVSPRFRGSALNAFFVCDVEQMMMNKRPALWMHGHTHDSCDYNVPVAGNNTGSTHVVCNPRGYWPDNLNPEFRNNLIIELPTVRQGSEELLEPTDKP